MSDSENSKTGQVFEKLLVPAIFAALGAAAVFWVNHRGYTLYFGDAEAHLNIARRVLDSRTPGASQIGSVWLPLPHLLMLPLVWVDALWRSGLAGAASSALCFFVTGWLMFATARRLFLSTAAAAGVAGILALNANLLYLQAVPMTEPVLAATVAAVLYCVVRFGEAERMRWLAGAGLAGAAAALARYEGWALIPAGALFFLLKAGRRRWLVAASFAALASLGPLLWLAHNWWYWGDPLEFYRGPYSARAIYQRLLEGGMERFRGDGDWGQAAFYYWEAVKTACGRPAVWMGLTGIVAAVLRRRLWPLLLAVAPPLMIIASIHSGGTPIYLPHLWPFSYWNTRFGVTALPALALGAGRLVSLTPQRLHKFTAALVVLLAAWPWVGGSWPENTICWKESQVNSEARRQWVRQAAWFLRQHYRPGSGILMAFGDLPAVLREAGIPLRESLHQENQPAFQAAVARPDLALFEEWALAQAGDPVDKALNSPAGRLRYELRHSVAVQGEPELRIYRRK